MKAAERIVCCCVKCENIKLKVEAINHMAIARREKPVCSDERSLSDLTLCAEKQPPCLERKCDMCGVKSVSNALQSLLESEGKTEMNYE